MWNLIQGATSTSFWRSFKLNIYRVDFISCLGVCDWRCNLKIRPELSRIAGISDYSGGPGNAFCHSDSHYYFGLGAAFEPDRSDRPPSSRSRSAAAFGHQWGDSVGWLRRSYSHLERPWSLHVWNWLTEGLEKRNRPRDQSQIRSDLLRFRSLGLWRIEWPLADFERPVGGAAD